MGSLSRTLGRKSQILQFESGVDRKVSLLDDLGRRALERALCPMTANIDAAAEFVRAPGARIDISGWTLRLAVRPCGTSQHWHLTAWKGQEASDPDELARLRLISGLVDLTTELDAPKLPVRLSPLPARAHHFDWHRDGKTLECPAIGHIERVLAAMRKLGRRR